MQTGEERYRADPLFRQLVDMIEASYERLQYTPSEVRDAAMLAAMHYENRTVRHLFIHGRKGA